MAAGTRKMCTGYMRGIRASLGNAPPNMIEASQGPTSGIDLGDGVGDAQAGAGEQVVGQRVAEDAVEDDQQEQGEAHHPVDHARTPVGAGEEHAEEVQTERAGEHQGGPVVHLPHEQTGPHVEAQVDDRPVGVGHGDAAQRLVAPVVDDRRRRGVEEERHVDAGDDQDDEAVERDLAEEERPVVGEDVAQLVAQHAAAADVPAHPARRAARLGLRHVEGLGQPLDDRALAHRIVHDSGPTGSLKSPVAMRLPAGSIARGSWGSARAAGPPIGRAPSSTSKVD